VKLDPSDLGLCKAWVEDSVLDVLDIRLLALLLAKYPFRNLIQSGRE
jgi:hypothetical protein